MGPAVRDGVREASVRHPGSGIAVVPADLPLLTPADVSAVFREAARDPGRGAFVPDRAGTGTTFVVHAAGLEVRTRYGPASAARHRMLGLRVIEDAPWGARHDIDTVDDLLHARELGPGPCTREASARARDELRLHTAVGRAEVTRRWRTSR